MKWPGAAILCYHAITSPECPSASVANLPFGEITAQVEELQHHRHVVTVGELLRRHANGQSIAGLAAISFDDAYASLGTMVPWLRERGIPCSIFVTTEASRSGNPFWWDRVEDAHSLVTEQQWRAFENRLGLPQGYRDGQPKAFGPVRPVRQFILAEHQGRWPEEFENAIIELERDAGTATRQRPMTLSEIDAATAWDGVEIGVHTRTHPVLPLLHDGQLTEEVAGAWRLLRERYRNSVPVLAIPFGLFDTRTLRLAAEAGMSGSLTLSNRLLTARSSAGGIPRISMTRGTARWRYVANWSGLRELVRIVRKGGASGPDYPDLPSAVS